MSRALQIYYSAFDEAFDRLPNDVRRRIEEHLDDMGRRLESFPHYRMTGSTHFRLRVGDYRMIYDFDANQRVIHLLALGHRREVYR